MELNEAKQILTKAGFLVESENRTDEIASILSDVFGLEKIVSASTKGRVYYVTLGDGQHDVYVIATYNDETDILDVKINYGNFEDVFKNFASHVTKNEYGCEPDEELDSWISDVMDEWTDAFGY